MRILFAMLSAGLASFLMISTPVLANKGLEIATEVIKRDQGWGDTSSKMTMILKDKYGQSTQRSLRNKSLEGSTEGDKSLVIFDTPGDVRGTAFLSHTKKTGSDDQWLYLPALKRVKRIASMKYLEKGSAFYAPAASGVEMAESYLNNSKKQLPCAVHLNGEYKTKDIYAGVPVIIGSNGVEKIIELDLSPEEKENFQSSVKAVRELSDATKKIDPDLN